MRGHPARGRSECHEHRNEDGHREGRASARLPRVLLGDAVDCDPGDGLLLLLFGANPDASFAEWVYRALDRVMKPFRGIFESVDLSGNSVLDVSVLFAMIVYGMLALALRALIDWLTYRIFLVQRGRSRDLDAGPDGDRDAAGLASQQRRRRRAEATATGQASASGRCSFACQAAAPPTGLLSSTRLDTLVVELWRPRRRISSRPAVPPGSTSHDPLDAKAGSMTDLRVDVKLDHLLPRRGRRPRRCRALPLGGLFQGRRRDCRRQYRRPRAAVPPGPARRGWHAGRATREPRQHGRRRGRHGRDPERTRGRRSHGIERAALEDVVLGPATRSAV